MHAVGAVAPHRPFKIVATGPDGSFTMTVQGVSIETVIDRIRSRRIAMPAGMLSFAVTDTESGESRSCP